MVLYDFSSNISSDIGYIGYGAINVDLYDKADFLMLKELFLALLLPILSALSKQIGGCFPQE